MTYESKTLTVTKTAQSFTITGSKTGYTPMIVGALQYAYGTSTIANIESITTSSGSISIFGYIYRTGDYSNQFSVTACVLWIKNSWYLAKKMKLEQNKYIGNS